MTTVIAIFAFLTGVIFVVDQRLKSTEDKIAHIEITLKDTNSNLVNLEKKVDQLLARP